MIRNILRLKDAARVHGKLKYAACYQSTQTVAQHEKPSLETALPYDSIPGPTRMEIFKGYLPNGKYANLNIVDFMKKLREEYGEIVKLPGFLRAMEIVMTMDPQDFEVIMRAGGKWPVRNGLETFTYYRKHVNPELFIKSGGLLAEHGEKWAEVRTKVNPVMMLPKIVKLYVPQIDNIAQEFTQKIRDIRDSNNEVPKTFNDYLCKWSLESISYIALNQRLNLLDESNTSTDGQNMIRHVEDFFEQSATLELKPNLWRYVRTPMFNKQMKTLTELTSIIIRKVNEAAEKYEKESYTRDDSELSVLEKLLKIDRNIAIVMAADMMFAGIDTTSGLSLSLIYALAKNPDKQQKLRDELMSILPEKDTPFTIEKTTNMPYLRACLKESIRLYPIIVGNLREAGEDIVIKGYKIPKGTNMSMANVVPMSESKFYPRAGEFIPERWLKAGNTSECPSARTAHPFTYMPFGFGARACIGKRFAELEVEMLVSRLVRNFKIEWTHPDIKWKTHFLIVPDRPVQFTFTDVSK